MTRRSQELPPTQKSPKLSPGEKKHLDELLDEALKETFPASDPPAVIEPAPDSQRSEEDAGKSIIPRDQQ